MRSGRATITMIGLVIGLAAGCSGSGGTPSADNSGPASVISTAPATGKSIEIAVTAGKVTPALGRVEVAQGTRLRLVVTSDVADRIHMHGDDQEADLPAGTPVTLEWVADSPGVFDVETHRAGTVLVRLLVR